MKIAKKIFIWRTSAREEYHKATDALLPYKRTLDIYMSRWFGNTPIRQVTRKKGRGKARIEEYRDVTIEVICSEDIDSVISAKNANISKEMRKLTPDDQRITKIAFEASAKHKFFHWELEFPEIFYESGRRKTYAGFDAVVGNPPYGYRTFQDIKHYLENTHSVGGSENIAEYFLSQCSVVMQKKGRFGMIVPKQLTYVPTWCQIRELIKNRLAPMQTIIDATEAFEEVLLEQVIFVAGGGEQLSHFAAGIVEADEIRITGKISQDKLSSRIWPIHAFGEFDSMISRIESIAIPLGDICLIFHGLKNVRPKMNYDEGMPILRGDNISRYACNEDLLRLPKEYVAKSDIDRHCCEKIVAQQIVAHLTKPFSHIEIMAWIDSTDSLIFETLNTIRVKGNKYKLGYLLSIVNSKWNSCYVHRFIFNMSVRTMMYRLGYLDYTPIRRVDFSQSPESRNQKLAQLVEAYEGRQFDSLLQYITEHSKNYEPIKAEIHDFLCDLAQRMIQLNKQKQTLMDEFLTWLAKTVGIKADKPARTGIEVLRGKSFIMNYLGDYRKVEPELEFGELLKVLQRNKSRISVRLSDGQLLSQLELAYRFSLKRLIPIKEQLARTDWLIDQIVYRLYCLTEEEIAFVEGKKV